MSETTRGTCRVARVRRREASGDVEVHHLERIGALVRHDAGQQLVDRDAERVEVGAIVERAVHAPGLLRSDVGERPLEARGRAEAAALAAKLRRDVEVDELGDTALRVVNNVVGVHVLVNDVGRVHVAQDEREPRRQTQPLLQRQAPAREPGLERPASEVLEDERELAPVLDEAVGAHDAVEVEGAQQVVLVAEARELPGRSGMALRDLDDDGLPVRTPPCTMDGGGLAIVQALGYVVGGQQRHGTTSHIRRSSMCRQAGPALYLTRRAPTIHRKLP